MGNSNHCQQARGCEEGRADEWEGVIKKEMMDGQVKLLYAERGDGAGIELGEQLEVDLPIVSGEN